VVCLASSVGSSPFIIPQMYAGPSSLYKLFLVGLMMKGTFAPENITRRSLGRTDSGPYPTYPCAEEHALSPCAIYSIMQTICCWWFHSKSNKPSPTRSSMFAFLLHAYTHITHCRQRKTFSFILT
jgi:hypothetical protein